MAIKGWLKYGQRSLLLGIVLHSGLSALAMASGPTGTGVGFRPDPAAREKATACAIELGIRGQFDPLEGRDLIASLHAMNAVLETRIASGDLTPEKVFSEHLAFFVDAEVTDKHGQKVPYKELRLPHAYTGIYVPTGKKGKAVDPAVFDGALIALPGIGFSVSVAKSMMELAGTFNNGTNPSLAVTDTKKLRLISFPMDMPLNGLGENAPYGLGHPDGVMAVLHHARLILGALYPGKKFFMAGRSQGGLNVLEYAARYTDVERVVALNPSSPEDFIYHECIRNHEEMALPENIDAARAKGFDCVFHAKSWTAHHDYTPLYTVLKSPSLVPVLIQLGDEDTSYPQPYFMDHWKAFAAAQSEMRRALVYHGAHNLWTRVGRDRDKAERLFGQTTRDITQFFAPSLFP